MTPGDALAIATQAGTLLLEFTALFFAVSFAVRLGVRSLGPDAIRRAVAGGAWRATPTALVLGMITPFCSCSTVPVVAGMAKAGVPVPTLTAFLIVSPLVNPATVALLATLAGIGFAAAFVAASALLALTVAGTVTALRIVPRLPDGLREGTDGPVGGPWRDRIRAAAADALRELRALAPVILLVAGIGAVLYGRVDVEAVRSALLAAGPWAVPVAVVISVPIYASTALLLPLGSALLASGAQLGVVAAFLIGATGLSVPEGVLLQRLLGGRYLAAVASAFVACTVLLGYGIGAWPPGG